MTYIYCKHVQLNFFDFCSLLLQRHDLMLMTKVCKLSKTIMYILVKKEITFPKYFLIDNSGTKSLICKAGLVNISHA